MTNVQVGAALCFSVLVAIVHTIIQLRWAVRFRKLTEANSETYRSQLEDAKSLLEVIKKLNSEQRLIVKKWGKGSNDFVEFCDGSIGNYCIVMASVDDHLECNQHHLTKRANFYLEKFMKHVEGSIHQMKDAVDASK